jgi:predicted nuclease of predicted toxin-antitoxin system
MSIRDFKFLADENIDPDLVDYIAKTGFDIYQITTKTADAVILEQSFEEKRIVLTHDSDFGKMVYTEQKPFLGIIYLRPGQLAKDFHISTFKTILESNLDFSPPFILVAEKNNYTVKMRLRNKII